MLIVVALPAHVPAQWAEDDARGYHRIDAVGGTGLAERLDQSTRSIAGGD